MVIRSLLFSHKQNASNLSELELDEITNIAHDQAWLVASLQGEIQTAASILQSKNIRFSQRTSAAYGCTLVLGWECSQAAVISWSIVAAAKLFLNPKIIPYLLSAGFALFWVNDKWKEQTQMCFFAGNFQILSPCRLWFCRWPIETEPLIPGIIAFHFGGVLNNYAPLCVSRSHRIPDKNNSVCSCSVSMWKKW